MNDYKDLVAWQKSHQLTLKVYKITLKYPDDERFGLTSQIRRAASSVPTNIAEGYGQLTKTNYIRFLGMARGSALEVEYLLMLSYELDYIKEDQYKKLNNENKIVIKLINGLIRSLSQRPKDKNST